MAKRAAIYLRVSTDEQTTDNQLHLVVPNELSFDVGRSNVKRNLAQVLDKVAEGLRSATAASVRVVGHTDATGSEEGNERLSVCLLYTSPSPRDS